MLLDRLAAACTSVLPDATVIVTGSLALGDYQPGKSDVDLLVLSDAPTDGLVEAVEQAWSQEPGEFDLRVVRYAVAARPRRRPHLVLGISDYGDRFEVERDTEEADLVVEFSVCRQPGRTDVIGPVPDECSRGPCLDGRLWASSADVGRQVLIGRDEFFPARLDLVGFAASEVRG